MVRDVSATLQGSCRYRSPQNRHNAYLRQLCQKATLKIETFRSAEKIMVRPQIRQVSTSRADPMDSVRPISILQCNIDLSVTGKHEDPTIATCKANPVSRNTTEGVTPECEPILSEHPPWWRRSALEFQP